MGGFLGIGALVALIMQAFHTDHTTLNPTHTTPCKGVATGNLTWKILGIGAFHTDRDLQATSGGKCAGEAWCWGNSGGVWG